MTCSRGIAGLLFLLGLLPGIIPGNPRAPLLIAAGLGQGHADVFRFMPPWTREPRVAGGQEMTYSRSPQRHLNHFGLPTKFTEWARLAQDRAGWQKLVTTPPFAIGKPFVRQPRGDTRVTPEDRRRAVAQRAAEIAERRAVFDANNNN